MQQYDVVILGGGLAGLTLSIQLKLNNPAIKILVLERRKTEADEAAHKVGESTVELGSYYLREVVGLKEYLEKEQLPKFGLRFFFPNGNKEDIASRVGLGPRKWLYTPSHQLDRGTLENYLAKRTSELGTEVILNAIAENVDFSGEPNRVTYLQNGEEKTVSTKWVVDATGRGSFLKRKLGFKKPMEHHPNAVWWRLKGVIDVSQWSENETWRNYPDVKLRYLSTVHFMDKGYWVWVIPLGTKNTSIGIVADPEVHPFETFNTYEKAIEWLKINEPLCYKMLKPQTKNKMDFKVLKHYAHHSERIYNGKDRWAVTGEAGAFLDPFYSPGTDFIALNNTWLSDLILRDINGEDIQFRAEIYEQTHLSWVNSWIPIYQNKYPIFGNTQIMVAKILWDWAIYWSIPAVLFTNKAFTNLRMLKELFASPESPGIKFGMLNDQVQQLFLDWAPYDTEVLTDHFIDPVDLNFMLEFQNGITAQHGDKLMEQIRHNLKQLEKIAAELFRHVSAEVKGTPSDLKVDPYNMVLDAENQLNLPEPDNAASIEPDEKIKRDIEVMWLYSKKQLA